MVTPNPASSPKRWLVRWVRVLGLTLAPITLASGAAWIVCASMPGASWSGAPSPASEGQRALSEELRATVEALCQHGERNLEHPAALEHAVELLKPRLAASGREVSVEAFDCGGATATNLFVDLPGRSSELVVVGAHYDTARGSPGANDNASGVAALCALARRFADRSMPRALRFVAFANEEPPRFRTELMGSRVHAARAKERGERVVAMLALETLGCYSDAAGSQRYPIGLLSLAYPTRGDFVAFVGDLGSRSLVRDCVRAFREHARIPSEGAALPAWIPGVDWSDHASFWPHGVPALMVTDTAVFRDPHYHRASDTPEKLDYGRLALVVEALERVIAAQAGATDLR